jgi:hypothetical protein
MQEKSPVFEILCPIPSKPKIVETIKNMEKIHIDVLNALGKTDCKNI